MVSSELKKDWGSTSTYPVAASTKIHPPQYELALVCKLTFPFLIPYPVLFLPLVEVMK